MASEQFMSAWAKSHPIGSVSVEAHLPLIQHMADSGAVAGLLWDHWLPDSTQRLFEDELGPEARGVLQFLAAGHDTGKISPAFAAKSPELATPMHDARLDSGAAARDPLGALAVPHSIVSYIAIKDWLVENRCWPADAAGTVAIVAGGHHGIQPSDQTVARVRATPSLLGEGLWASTRFEALDHLASDYHVATWLAQMRPLSQQLQVLSTGLVILSDWIASNTALFPLLPVGKGIEALPTIDQRARKGWKRLGLPSPWKPLAPGDDVGKNLAARFRLPRETSPRPVQEAAVKAAKRLERPGLLIIEAPTGEGKTEAALLAAEVIAERFGLGGVGFYLPTQATSDAMFLRVLGWLDSLPDDGAETARDAAKAVALLHGRALHNTAYRDLSRLSGADGIWDEHIPSEKLPRFNVHPIVVEWLEGPKRPNLADFVTATIDQFLLIALRARHLPLRHLGIARKVVILDEVHAADHYMNVFMHRALEWCGALQIPVIALSATLPDSQREALHAAYTRGVNSTSSGPSRRSREPQWRRQGVEKPENEPTPYPAITSSSGGMVTFDALRPSTRTRTARIELADDSDATLLSQLRDALVDGGCVLIIRNTVTRAQATADLLTKHFGPDVRLMHARFMGHDRLSNDAWLRERLGPTAGQSRPSRAVIVATQVVEQSLDIDADLLITDLAPADLLVQRLGRLHRHQRGPMQTERPPRLREARCIVVGTEDWGAGPPKPVKGSAKVYSRHLLIRTATILVEKAVDTWLFTAPDDVAGFVQPVYSSEALGPSSWQPALAEAKLEAERLREEKRLRAQGYLLDPPRGFQEITDWVGTGGNKDQERVGLAQVRDGADSLEVLLLRESGGALYLLDGVAPDGDAMVPTAGPVPEAQALLVAGSAVRLPNYLSLGEIGQELVQQLCRRYYEHWQRDPLLRGQLVLALDERNSAKIGPLTFTYDARRGLEVRRA